LALCSLETTDSSNELLLVKELWTNEAGWVAIEADAEGGRILNIKSI
jgi:hypothetical protein